MIFSDPSLMTLVQRASELAERVHSGQFRRDGVTPYIRHVQDVAIRLQDESVHVIATGWLHDVLEDSELTAENLRGQFPGAVVDAVELLTHDPMAGYEPYIHRIKLNEIAKAVKVADILSNLSDDPTPKQVKKYAKALSILL